MKKIALILFLVAGISLASTVVVQAQFEQKLTIQGSAGFLNEPNYGYMGISVDAGILYNFNRRSSLITNVRVFLMGDEFNALMGLGYKFNILPSKKLNPYVFFEGTINYYLALDFSYQGYAFGAYPGVGLDYRITDNIGIFAQGGMNYILDIPNDLVFNIQYMQMGVRLNFLKSKDL